MSDQTLAQEGGPYPRMVLRLEGSVPWQLRVPLYQMNKQDQVDQLDQGDQGDQGHLQKQQLQVC